jgi:type IV secretion system protein TrbF
MQALADAKVKNPPLNPYLDARRQHASESARAHSVARFSQALCLLALLIVLAALSAIAYLGSQSKFVPYVVQMDRYGAVTPLGPAESVARTDPRVIQWSVGSFVSSWRMVTPDAAIQTNAVYQVYSMLRERDPAKRSRPSASRNMLWPSGKVYISTCGLIFSFFTPGASFSAST